MSLTPLTLDGSEADGLRLSAAASRGSWRRLVLWIVAPAMALVWWMSRRLRAGRRSARRAEEIDIDRERVRVLWSCGGLPMTSSSEVALTDIDALELHIGTAERLLPLKIQLRCRGSAERHELTIPFVVADCDRREEALDFCFRLARAIGAARYRVRHENDETLQVELLLGRHQAGSYRTAVGAPDGQAVPLEQHKGLRCWRESCLPLWPRLSCCSSRRGPCSSSSRSWRSSWRGRSMCRFAYRTSRPSCPGEDEPLLSGRGPSLPRACRCQFDRQNRARPGDAQISATITTHGNSTHRRLRERALFLARLRPSQRRAPDSILFPLKENFK